MTMLTVAQPTAYGHKSVHDLPTPPSTSRPSPPPAYHEQSYRNFTHYSHFSEIAAQSMSAPHRGLPPPAAMGLQPQQPPSAPPPQQPIHQSHPAPPQPPQSMPPHSHAHSQALGQLPPPPQQWQGGEESMKSWLMARAEEEKTRQEEERTRQEQLRLEQRRIEGDILRSSLSGGIPPHLIPLVFAGMGSSGGGVSKTTLEWAQQYFSGSQGQYQQLLPASQGPVSPEHPREYAGQGGGPFAATTPGPGTGPPSQGAFGSHAGSPTRQRGQTISGPLSRGPPGLSSFPSGVPQGQHQPQGHGHSHSGHQDQPLYFHHWQPPSSHAGSVANPPGTPSGEGSKKRKAPGPQQPGGGTGEQRLRSPPILGYGHSGDLAARRGHKRQRSDVSWRYSSPGVGDWRDQRDRRRKSLSPQRESSESGGRTVIKGEGGVHSVSSLLSREPESTSDQYRPARTPTQQTRQHEQESHHPAHARYASEGREESGATPPQPAARGEREMSQSERLER